VSYLRVLFFQNLKKIGERKLGGYQFCDGGLLSNTPFRELLQAHQDYWLRVKDTNKQKIPDLEVYIVNVHPSKGAFIQEDDVDGTKDRINDITFFDRNSHYNENVVTQTTDYLNPAFPMLSM
jgi:NTE family protein